MRQEDAYQYLRVTILNPKDFEGVLLCTDGLSSPYQSYENFTKSFIRPTMRKILNTKSLTGIETMVEEVALKFGVGDDVSLSFILNEHTNVKYYR